MKKLLIFICVSILLFGTVLYGINHIKNRDFIPSSSDFYDDNVVTVSVTAVGDCTFGTDANFSGGGFRDELKKLNNDYTYFFKKVRAYFENDDLTIVNFEGVLSDSGTRADKEYAFRGEPEYINILTSSSIEAANLANNHTLDYGEFALTDTKDIMSENDISWFEGESFTVRYIKGIKVGLIGTNALTYEGRSRFVKNMEALKSCNPDLIIASFHWGEEKATQPNGNQTYMAHLAIDNGADLVLGHHPHVLQGIEKYKGKYIVYSLGNFSFAGNRHPSDKDTMIFRQDFTFENNKLLPYDYVSVIPCSVSSSQDFNNYQPQSLTGKEFERVKNKIIKRSSYFKGTENIEFIEGM